MIKEYFNGKEINISLNPEESVVIGAAIRGAIASHCKNEKIEKLFNSDVSHFSYGIETVGRVMNVLIPKNSTIVCKTSLIVSTYSDNQSSALISLYEGERQFVKDNNLIESIKIYNITPLPRGEPFLEVTIDTDYDYKITFTAVDKTKVFFIFRSSFFTQYDVALYILQYLTYIDFCQRKIYIIFSLLNLNQ